MCTKKGKGRDTDRVFCCCKTILPLPQMGIRGRRKTDFPSVSQTMWFSCCLARKKKKCGERE